MHCTEKIHHTTAHAYRTQRGGGNPAVSNAMHSKRCPPCLSFGSPELTHTLLVRLLIAHRIRRISMACHMSSPNTALHILTMSPTCQRPSILHAVMHISDHGNLFMGGRPIATRILISDAYLDQLGSCGRRPLPNVLDKDLKNKSSTSAAYETLQQGKRGKMYVRSPLQ